MFKFIWQRFRIWSKFCDYTGHTSKFRAFIGFALGLLLTLGPALKDIRLCLWVCPLAGLILGIIFSADYWFINLPNDLLIERKAQKRLDELVQDAHNTEALWKVFQPDSHQEEVSRINRLLTEIPSKDQSIGNWLDKAGDAASLGYMFLYFSLSHLRDFLGMEDNEDRNQYFDYDPRFKSLYAQLSEIANNRIDLVA